LIGLLINKFRPEMIGRMGHASVVLEIADPYQKYLAEFFPRDLVLNVASNRIKYPKLPT
jgi:hypothetical protein